jgi:hypothetical protein
MDAMRLSEGSVILIEVKSAREGHKSPAFREINSPGGTHFCQVQWHFLIRPRGLR